MRAGCAGSAGSGTGTQGTPSSTHIPLLPLPLPHTLAAITHHHHPSPFVIGFLTPNTTQHQLIYSFLLFITPQTPSHTAPATVCTTPTHAHLPAPPSRAPPRALAHPPKSASGHTRHQSRVVRTGYCNIGRIPIIDVNASAPAPAPKSAPVAHIYTRINNNHPSSFPITASQSVFIDLPLHHRSPSRRQRAHTLAPTPP